MFPKSFLCSLILLSVAAAGRQNGAFGELSARIRKLSDAGKYEEGLKAAERALALAERAFGKQDPKVALSLGWLARLNWRAGRFTESERITERLLDFEPKDYNIQLDLGRILQTQGRAQQAERWLRKALEIQPNDPRAYADLGIILHKRARYAEAAQMMETALRLEPNDYALHVRLARSHETLGHAPRRALERARLALERDGQRLEAAMRRAAERQRAQIDALLAQLRALSPRSILERGYAIVRAGGRVVRSTSAVSPGACVAITVGDGSFTARVEELQRRAKP